MLLVYMAKGDDYGIGDERSYSILEIARLFNTKIEFLPERKGNRSTSFIDTSKTKSLGWKIQNSVLNELEKFISDNKK
jgi:UDP-glucose 4-epimerase